MVGVATSKGQHGLFLDRTSSVIPPSRPHFRPQDPLDQQLLTRHRATGVEKLQTCVVTSTGAATSKGQNGVLLDRGSSEVPVPAAGPKCKSQVPIRPVGFQHRGTSPPCSGNEKGPQAGLMLFPSVYVTL